MLGNVLKSEKEYIGPKGNMEIIARFQVSTDSITNMDRAGSFLNFKIKIGNSSFIPSFLTQKYRKFASETPLSAF